MKYNLQILDEIQKVEVPPFLLTRIKQQIENSSYNKFSFKLALSLSLSFIFVILLNTSIILHHKNQRHNENNFSHTFGLVSTNSIYNE